ncbi:MAG: flagellar protein FliT [Nitrosomonas sp.]|uniref:flagellar protein FliT n=1 Tax=Nitrosomonas sp. TaxID=42353 RepID=UPI0025EA08C8|nr:flagellar protein FliT [Nitrosomonas sp.]MBY0475500.1 flagellar protein FliT [Nitrosomonas sp.]
MDNAHTIITYNAILATTGKMLTAAQNSEWDQLVSLEQECRKLTDSLKKNDTEPLLDQELQQKKVKIIHQILDNDAQIRAIIEPWMARLQDMLSANKRTRNLQQTYQPVNNV